MVSYFGTKYVCFKDTSLSFPLRLNHLISTAGTHPFHIGLNELELNTQHGEANKNHLKETLSTKIILNKGNKN